jgi:hypothetical protein
MSRVPSAKVSVLLASLVGSLMLAGLSSAGTNDKVTICHFPPGNPANYQTITISAAALQAHLAHGDFPGPCANDCNLFGSVCNDGNPCNTDTCNPDGTCAHTPKNCDDSNVCTTDSCDPATGDCVNTPVTGLTYCEDGNDCADPDTCTSTGRVTGQRSPAAVTLPPIATTGICARAMSVPITRAATLRSPAPPLTRARSQRVTRATGRA